jgi:hypothetical protein
VLAISMLESSDLVDVRGATGIAVLCALVAIAGVALALQHAAVVGEGNWTSPSNFVVPAMAVGVGAGVGAVVHDWRFTAVVQTFMAGAIYASGYVTLERFVGRERPGHEFLHDGALIVVLLGAFFAILAGVPSLFAKMVLIFVVTFLAAYESFFTVVRGEQESIFYSQTVAVVTTAIAFGLVYAGILGEGYVAVILLLVWYVERGVIAHVLSRTMTRSIVGEYAVMAFICIILVANALLNH